MDKKYVLNLVSAFAVVALIIGIIITAFAKDNTAASDAGKIMVIISFIVAAVCQIIVWITGKKRKS